MTPKARWSWLREFWRLLRGLERITVAPSPHGWVRGDKLTVSGFPDGYHLNSPADVTVRGVEPSALLIRVRHPRRVPA
jgi:hypothetical protein